LQHTSSPRHSPQIPRRSHRGHCSHRAPALRLIAPAVRPASQTSDCGRHAIIT
jgi:hypothetical protein